MTSPENFRRRQRLEGIALLILGLWVAFWTWNGAESDSEILHCVESKVQDLSDTSSVRADLNERETEANRRVNLAELEVKNEQEFIDRLTEYRDTIQAIQKERKENPLPPFPPGECNE